MSLATRKVLIVLSALLLSFGVTSCAKKNPGGAKKKGKPETTGSSTGNSTGTSTTGADGDAPNDIFSSYPDSSVDNTGGGGTYDPNRNGLGNYGNNNDNQGYGGISGSGSGYTPDSQNYSPGDRGGYNSDNRSGQGSGSNGGIPNNSNNRNNDRGRGRTPGLNPDDQGNGPRLYFQATANGVTVRFSSTNDPRLETNDRLAPVTIKFSQTITTEERSAALQGSLDVRFSRGSQVCSVTSSSYTVSASQDKYRRAQCN